MTKPDERTMEEEIRRCAIGQVVSEQDIVKISITNIVEALQDAGFTRPPKPSGLDVGRVISRISRVIFIESSNSAKLMTIKDILLQEKEAIITEQTK